MKDRDTLYRVVQKSGMACCFDSFIPGFSSSDRGQQPLIAYAEQVMVNARAAGLHVEGNDPDFFGSVEAPFVITPGQSGKVRGDVFEMLCRAILWNCAAAMRESPSLSDHFDFELPPGLSAASDGREYAVLTLGDNYDLKNLLKPTSADRLRQFEEALAERGTSIKYSTPDVVCIDISAHDDETKEYFGNFITDLSSKNQQLLSDARAKLEGHVEPSDIVFAAGVKTSIRSDRMYQFLYEANSWKFLWARAFGLKPSEYFVLTAQTFGADPKKLHSVDFSSLVKGMGEARRAIDGVYHFESPSDLIDWFVAGIKSHRGAVPAGQSTA